jgi:hypothetical protein
MDRVTIVEAEQEDAASIFRSSEPGEGKYMSSQDGTCNLFSVRLANRKTSLGRPRLGRDKE